MALTVLRSRITQEQFGDESGVPMARRMAKEIRQRAKLNCQNWVWGLW